MQYVSDLECQSEEIECPHRVHSLQGRLFPQAHLSFSLGLKPHLFVGLGLLFRSDLLACQSLLLDTLLPPLPRSLGLRTLGVHLVLEDSLTGLLCLGLVDVFNEGTLMLEGVTLKW